MVSDLFDEGAPYYEWICRVMSFGTGAQYRKQALREAGLSPGMRVLDEMSRKGLRSEALHAILQGPERTVRAVSLPGTR